ncbi:hypothetical protein ASF41_12565 [Methylobacterium sp. Leaf111]|uniref:hypothetical protein n=1 Tax=Methylobacterium sp. Leaf111 TaxID=1736257 RepID=UPI0006FBFAD1|nr:hypothetical protein [Methylobacterium sp. Leaf111]KQP52477.1 hypothetical protein ASF41_12565 [Methylobacterium sp. Leaf111]
MKKRKRKISKPKLPKDNLTTVPVGDDQGSSEPDHSDLTRRIKENPLSVAAEARHKLHEVRSGYRRELYAALALIVGIARHYHHDYKAWKIFFDQPYFQTGKQKPKARAHHTDALRHTMNYVFDAKSKQARSRTGKYAAALHPMMIIGVPVHLVAEEIEKAGGIEKLYEAYREREAHKPKKGRKQARTEEEYAATAQYFDLRGKKDGEPEDITLGDLEDGDEQHDDEMDDLDLSEGEGYGEAHDPLDIYRDMDFGLEPSVERGFDPEGRPTIEFEMTADRQSRFIGLGKRRAVVHIQGLGHDENGWQRIRVRKVIWKRRRA